MFRVIKRFFLENRYELVLTFFIFTNLFPHWFPQFLYYISFLMILNKMRNFRHNPNAQGKLFYCFMVVIWVSSAIGMTLDLRLIIFSLILYMSMPVNSIKWHLYKMRLLNCIFVGFGLATIVNFYAKLTGANMIVIDEYAISMGRVAEFSGFANYAMWTSCAAALSTMFFVSMAFRGTLKSKMLKYVCYIMALISLYITMISASRSAFFLSLACSLLIIKMHARKNTMLIRNIVIAGFTASVFAPFLIDNSTAMMNKKNGLDVTLKNTSRDELWSQRWEEFESSPIFGIGFAAHGVGADKKVGRNESGGSFISVLAQSGILGFLLVIAIWKAAFLWPRQIGKDPDIILIYSGFVFMSIHSIIEGYMFQAGWYMCLVIWLIVGFMIEHKSFRKKYPQLMNAAL